MSTTSDTSLPLSVTDKRAACRTWCRRIVFSLLDGLPRDSLELRLPEGEVLRFGSTSCEAEPARMTVRRQRFFRRVVLGGEIGFGEAFTDGDWESDDLARVLRFFVRNVDANPTMSGAHRRMFLVNLMGGLQRLGHWLRRNTKTGSRSNIAAHYDLSNRFYGLWLDSTWTYSSAFFEAPSQSLEDAQEAKYRRLAERLQLQPGQHVLEIGCGWGGCALHLAKNFGVKVTGVTISQEQFDLARQRVAEAGLEGQIDIRFCDYRDLDGQFDAIISIEMLEAVGHDFLETYFRKCQRLLRRTGQLGLQVILAPDSRYEEARKSADWIKKHIFPGGQLPSLAAINRAINETGDLTLQHFESFGIHYAKTLRLWRERFNAELERVRQLDFDEIFIRKWNYYLAYCEAAFDTHNINVAQFVYAFPNRETGPLK